LHRKDITADDELVQHLINFCKAHKLDVAGIEWVEDEAGNRYVYDINGTSNYNSDVEAEHGIHGMDEIAGLCARELAAIQQGW
jgi:hypothetical protein